MGCGGGSALPPGAIPAGGGGGTVVFIDVIALDESTGPPHQFIDVVADDGTGTMVPVIAQARI